VGDGGGVPREAGGAARLTFKAMVSLSQKKKEGKEASTKGEEMIGCLTCQTKENYG